jgi:hypothetical protein
MSAGDGGDPPAADRARRRHFLGWWSRVETTCGPATGIRTLFDVVAMPLCGLLGYRARDAVFTQAIGRARLDTASHHSVALVVLPWSRRPSLAWRDAIGAARLAGASWAFVLAPPFLSVVDARGHASRRSLEITLPHALSDRGFGTFLAVTRAAAFEPAAPSEPPPIELLLARAARFQDRVRDDLQNGVVQALAALSHAVHRRRPVTRRDRMRQPASRFDEALTIVYRVLFLLFAESRALVPRDDPIYAGAYTVGALCRDAISADPPPGAWEGLAAISRLSRQGVHLEDTIVKPFNGALFARASAPSLELPRRHRGRSTAFTRDAAMRSALAALGSRPGRGGREEIAYADLGVEQLGAVYEQVLDLDPERIGTVRDSTRTAAVRHSRQRKESATFYTPQPLAEFVVRRTLEPLVAGATAARILSLRVVDPAMGSGAFLVAACRFLAAAYEHALVEEGRCAESDLDDTARSDIRRLIAERCLAGVDLNPTAVQLARLSLWLTSLARDKPLGFFDHRLRAGNSLVGASPDDLLRLTGRTPRTSLPLLEAAGLDVTLERLVRPLADLIARRDDTVEAVRSKEAWWRGISGDASPLEPWRLACHLWCARWFLGRLMPSASETRGVIDAVLGTDRSRVAPHSDRRLAAARSVASAHRFFHWPLEYPDVFYDDDGKPKAHPGFDAVIGNPPWEMVRREPGDRHVRSTGLVRFIRESGLFPSCARGHMNLYQPFVDRALSIARAGGRVGLVVPWGLASDDGAAALRRRLLDRDGLETIVGLDNASGIFPIHRGMRFMMIAARAGERAVDIAARFGVRHMSELDELPGRDSPHCPAFPLRITAAQLARIGGPACRVPDVRHAIDLQLLDRLARDYPALGSAQGWAATFGRELNATDDRDAFGDRGLPILEGKHVAPFRADPASAAENIDEQVARRRLPHAPFARARLAYRDVAAVGNRTSLIAAVLPAGVVTTHTLFCLRNGFPLEQQHFLCGLFNSVVLNAVVRMLMGGHVTTSLVEGLPVPVWTGAPDQRRIAALARVLSEQHSTEAWAELHAAVARLYRLSASELARVLDLFPLLPVAEREGAARAFSRTGLPV